MVCKRVPQIKRNFRRTRFYHLVVKFGFETERLWFPAVAKIFDTMTTGVLYFAIFCKIFIKISIKTRKFPRIVTKKMPKSVTVRRNFPVQSCF